MIREQAAIKLAAIDPAAIAAVVAQFPPADEIGPRRNWTELTPPHPNRGLPKALPARRDYLASAIVTYKKELESDIKTYDAYREKGPALLLPHEIVWGNPLDGLRCALQLKHNHITYALSMLILLTLELEDVQAALASAKPSP